MHSIIETVVLSAMFSLYWLNRKRRKYLKKRIGTNALQNIYQTARNFSFMLQRKELSVRGNTRLLRKGGILYSFHFGVWELMPATLRKKGYRLGVVVNRYCDSNKNFLTYYGDKFLNRFRSRHGVKIFYKEDTIKIVKFIQRGGLLGILVDGNSFYAKYDKVQKLARLCNVPSVPFAAYRHNGTGILEIGCNLVSLVKQRPSDYLWLYRSRSDQPR